MADSHRKPATAGGSHGTVTGDHHEHGMGRYVAVWLALLVGTVVTVVTGRMDFGSMNIVIAMTIASIKATLVVLFFMHLWDEGGVNRLVFVTSLVFVLVMIGGVFGDLMFRLPTALPYGGPSEAPISAPAEHGATPAARPPAHQ